MDDTNDFQTLVIDDTAYPTLHTEKFRRRRPYVAPDPNELRAFIPGVIREMFVAPGARVRWGDNLFVLEAMKMKNAVTSPRDGRIKSVRAAVGQQVAKNELLIEFEPE